LSLRKRKIKEKREGDRYNQLSNKSKTEKEKKGHNNKLIPLITHLFML
jgi:hypothetical protein